MKWSWPPKVLRPSSPLKPLDLVTYGWDLHGAWDWLDTAAHCLSLVVASPLLLWHTHPSNLRLESTIWAWCLRVCLLHMEIPVFQLTVPYSIFPVPICCVLPANSQLILLYLPRSVGFHPPPTNVAVRGRLGESILFYHLSPRNEAQFIRLSSKSSPAQPSHWPQVLLKKCLFETSLAIKL